MFPLSSVQLHFQDRAGNNFRKLRERTPNLPICSSEKDFGLAIIKEPKCSRMKSTAITTFLGECKESVIALQTSKILKYKLLSLQFSAGKKW